MSLLLFWGSGEAAGVVVGTGIAMRVDLRVSGVWTDITADVLAGPGLDLKFGIGSNGPTDRIADVGVCSFTLRNDAGNSGGMAGYYSPVHANRRAGFTHGALVRVVFTSLATEYPRFFGKIASIDPTPGRSGPRRTRVLVHDLMADLVESDLRNVTLQVDRTEAQLLQTLVESLPATAQPLAVQFDAGLDTSPFAYDTLGAGAHAIGPASDLVISSLGYLHMLPTGVLRYENRHHRQVVSTAYTFTDDMVGLVVPTTLDGVFNHVRATFHPKTVDATATTVLWAQTGAAPAIGPSETIDIWGDYYKSSNPAEHIGGTAQINPVATTDYLANTLADGTGTNKTANVTITAAYFASTVKFTITNTDASTVYLTFLQCRGKGLYDHSPVTVESTSVQSYGDRPINLDLPYQSNYNITQDLADYVRFQFDTLATQIHALTFIAGRSAAFTLAALAAQVGDRIEITETQTGLLSVAAFIQSIQLTVQPREGTLHVTCRLGLASTTYFNQVWVLDDAALSLLDISTIPGFA